MIISFFLKVLLSAFSGFNVMAIVSLVLFAVFLLYFYFNDAHENQEFFRYFKRIGKYLNDKTDYKTRRAILVFIFFVSMMVAYVFDIGILIGPAIIMYYVFNCADLDLRDEKELIRKGINIDSVKHYVGRCNCRLIIIILLITWILALLFRFPILPPFYVLVFICIDLQLELKKAE